MSQVPMGVPDDNTPTPARPRMRVRDPGIPLNISTAPARPERRQFAVLSILARVRAWLFGGRPQLSAPVRTLDASLNDTQKSRVLGVQRRVTDALDGCLSLEELRRLDDWAAECPLLPSAPDEGKIPGRPPTLEAHVTGWFYAQPLKDQLEKSRPTLRRRYLNTPGVEPGDEGRVERILGRLKEFVDIVEKRKEQRDR